MLEHRLTTVFQQKWLVKLMEFEFSIEYKQGKENVATDALSRLKDIECKALTAQTIQPNVLDRIQSSRVSDASLATIIPALKENSSSHKHYTWLNDQLRRKGKLVVGKDLQLRQELLHWFHNSTPGGHSGKIATCKRIQVVLYWKGLTLDVKQFMQQCATYQQCKYDHSAYLGLLQPLHVPDHVWQHISMDFIEGIPLSNSKQAIFVVVDPLQGRWRTRKREVGGKLTLKQMLQNHLLLMWTRYLFELYTVLDSLLLLTSIKGVTVYYFRKWFLLQRLVQNQLKMESQRRLPRQI